MKLKLQGIEEPVTVTPAGHGLFIEKLAGLSVWFIHTQRGYRIGDGIHSRQRAVLLAELLGPLAAKFGFNWKTAERPMHDDPQWDALAAEVRKIAENGVAFIMAHNAVKNLKLTPAMVYYVLLADDYGWLPGYGSPGRDMRSEQALVRRGLLDDDRVTSWLGRKLNDRGLELRAVLRTRAEIHP